VFFLFACVLGMLVLHPVRTEAQAKPLNVLFIAVDDLRVELGCYGSPHVHSPHIDSLAARGTLFTHAYCQQTVCNPSRASLLTGMRPDTLRVWDLPTHFRVNHPEAVTLPQLFKQNGYHTQNIGKIFHNWRQDEWKGDPVSWSVPAVMHYENHGNDTPRVEGELPPNLATKAERTECRDVPDEAYFDGRVANAAVEALKELSARDDPFFLAVGFWKPHLPFNAPKKYWDLYDPAEIDLPENLEPPRNVPEIALTDDRVAGNYSEEQILELRHGHLAAVSYMDAMVGKVLDALEETGLHDNTLVVFWSDHGVHVGEHGLMRKRSLFEWDAAVPLLIATPGGKGGQRVDGMVELLDLYPTLAELCSLDPPKGLEGTSLAPILKDPGIQVKKASLTQSPRPDYPQGEMPEVMGYSIRTPDFRYTEWRDFETGKVQARELYDHGKDSGENTNVAGDPDYAHQLEILAGVLEETLANKEHPR
jgi:iduronate 2-sulfatase